MKQKQFSVNRTGSLVEKKVANKHRVSPLFEPKVIRSSNIGVGKLPEIEITSKETILLDEK